VTMNLFAPKLPIDEPRVLAAIRDAEQLTSGEIRVLLARHAASDPVAAAQKHFQRLRMTHTKHRNAVLIFVAPKSRTFAVIGDAGVHEKCGDAFWRELAAAMETQFRAGDFTGGLVHGIARAGALLAEHFPREPDDRNELPDTVAHS
jgi:uncharacterized membrane protein